MDLKARLLEISLVDLFGRVHDDVPIYGSGGFTSHPDEQTVAQLESWVDQGASNVKIKVGEDWGWAGPSSGTCTASGWPAPPSVRTWDCSRRQRRLHTQASGAGAAGRVRR